MKITTRRSGTELTISPEGEINALTSPELDELINRELPDTKEMILDFAKCDYVSSAGFRVLLSTHKEMMKKGGSLTLMHVGEYIMEAFEVTGLDGVFDVRND